MTYTLCSGVSYCRVGERLLFLDLATDRYLCLPPEIEDCFVNLSKGENGDPVLTQCLVQTRIVEPASEPNLSACRTTQPPTSSLLDSPLPKVRASLPALTRLGLANSSLKWRGFFSSIAGLRQRKIRKAGSSGNAGLQSTLSAEDKRSALGAASAFEACDAFLGSKDKCLPRSLAAAHRMLDVGLIPHLVVAVRLDPFHAHAWVQWGEHLVNERVDATRAFTPILVI